MHMITLIILFIVGYAVAWLLRYILSNTNPSMSVCNLEAKGISIRTWITIVLAVIGLFTQMPLLTFLAGFVFYESRSQWCIVEGLRK
jgi:tetrahydromethanopterin S-methyltransferase subunit C